MGGNARLFPFTAISAEGKAARIPIVSAGLQTLMGVRDVLADKQQHALKVVGPPDRRVSYYTPKDAEPYLCLANSGLYVLVFGHVLPDNLGNIFDERCWLTSYILGTCFALQSYLPCAVLYLAGSHSSSEMITHKNYLTGQCSQRPRPPANVCELGIGPMQLLFIAFFCVATSSTLYKLFGVRGWSKRPRRLCLSCCTVTKPDQLRDGTFVCVVCSHRGPVELSSRAAFDHFRLIGQRPPSE